MNIYCFSTLSFAKLQFKSVINKAFHKHGVASFTDAWIETYEEYEDREQQFVASFTDAWIETVKPEGLSTQNTVASFTDAWIETYSGSPQTPSVSVASFTDAWIETRPGMDSGRQNQRRIFYRCVD